MSHTNWTTVSTVVMICLFAARLSGQEASLQQQVAAAKSGATVTLAAATYHEPLSIQRPLSIKGTSRDACVLEVTSNTPALQITSKRPITIESITIRWQLESSDGTQGTAAAVLAKDTDVTIRDCRIVALGNSQRCPMAISAAGFSKVKIENCEFEGFDFTIGYAGGAEGSVSDCVIRDMGHCGISVYTGSKVRVSNNVITGSKYHGLRCTGGELQAFNNLIIHNNNRGIYLGNKSARGRVRNNVIMGNGTGIGAFAQSDVTIESNLILDSEYAGIGTRDSCRLKVIKNIFQGNTRGIIQFAEVGKSSVQLGSNCFWNNETDVEDIELPKSSMQQDPQLADVANGQFTVANADAKKKRQGLTSAEPLEGLWVKWTQLQEQETARAELP